MPRGVIQQTYGGVVERVNQILDQYKIPLTIRQIFYRLISPPFQYFPGTPSMYVSYDKKLVVAREKGEVDWRRIVDYSRRIIDAPITYTCPYHFFDELNKEVPYILDRYTEDLWKEQGKYLRIFCEKNALADLVAEISLKYQVGLSVGGGYSSFTQVKSEVDRIERLYPNRDITILYLGDWDPTGTDIRRSLMRRLNTYGGFSFSFVNVALDENDIAVLPSNPMKKIIKRGKEEEEFSDPRSKEYYELYGDNTWELDALPPDELQVRVENAILKYIDISVWEESIKKMNENREDVIDGMAGVSVELDEILSQLLEPEIEETPDIPPREPPSALEQFRRSLS